METKNMLKPDGTAVPSGEPGSADLGFAQVDLDRERRNGHPEVIYGEGKSAEQIAAIMARLGERTAAVLATRVDADKAAAVLGMVADAEYYPQARAIVWRGGTAEPAWADGHAAVVCAGTTDIPVAEEAAVTLAWMGCRTEKFYDVGVAGIHRLFARLDDIRAADVIVVAAGMEGALASVVGGLVSKPIIAVPTSVGYGASFQGLAALLAMLNSCAPGVTVVNIDNGFGAGYAAGTIIKNRAAPVGR